MASVKGGSVTDRILDATGGYIKLMVVVAVLFGASLMLSLNHVIIDSLANVIGGIVKEVPGGANTVKKIQGSSCVPASRASANPGAPVC